MLWLGLKFPLLPINALSIALHEPVAVVDTMQRLHAVSPAAYTLGVRPGVLSSRAIGLWSQLQVLPRQPQAERQALENLATWATQFSSRVCLDGESGLVLEVGGSLSLFGGLDSLLQKVQAGLHELAYPALMGVAPSISGAQVLARSRLDSTQAGMQVLNLEALDNALRHLPLSLLDWPSKILRALYDVGVRTIGQAKDLPADGFIRRYGKARRMQLQQVYGEVPEVRDWYQPPAHFQCRRDLPFETSNSTHLEMGFERLFKDLQAFLYGRDCAVGSMLIEFEHASQRSTYFRLGLQSQNRDIRRWQSLLHEHLQRQRVPEPVRGIALSADEFGVMHQPQMSLLAESNPQDHQALLERLQARLGPQSLRKLQCVDEHRPELMGRAVALDAQTSSSVQLRRPPRPLWLLEPPQALRLTDFELQSGPERLETGWWDGQPCRRDYYRAIGRAGQYQCCALWVFQSHRQAEGWFVHGLFG